MNEFSQYGKGQYINKEKYYTILEISYIIHTFIRVLSYTMTANGLGLGEGGELEVQMFMLAQMFIRIPNAQI